MLIKISNITVRAGDQEFFHGASWAIHKGENWAVIGPNGSGKTLLAYTLMRRLPLVAGTITYQFDDPAFPSGRSFLHAGEIALYSAETHRAFLKKFVTYHQARWQSFEGEEAPTVAQFFGLAGDEREDRVDLFDRLEQIFHLEPLLSRKIHLLSHGESRKVFLAHLLLQSPKMLILDDPFTGLDAASRGHLLALVEEIMRSNQTAVLLVGGRLSDLPTGTTHILALKDQQIAWQGERSQFGESVEFQPAVAPPEYGSETMLQKMAEWYSQSAENGAQNHAAMISFRHVSVRYGGHQILQGIDWSVQPGERWGLLGENGAGKTTLLSLILGDNPQAYRNEIALFGRQRGSGESIWQIKRKIGWVSPELQIYSDQPATCLDIVCSGFFDSVGLFRRPSARQTEIALGWMEALGIAALSQAVYNNQSSGAQRLALLARAMVKAPPLLILDEPCQGLDETHRRRFINIVDRICALTPVTLIYVSHYQDEFPRAVTRRLILENGKIARLE